MFHLLYFSRSIRNILFIEGGDCVLGLRFRDIYTHLLTSVSIDGVTASSTTPTTDVGSVFPVGYCVPEPTSGKLLQSGIFLGAVRFPKRNIFIYHLLSTGSIKYIPH